MTRNIQQLLAATALLLICSVSFAHTCTSSFKVYGAIGDRYNQLNGETGPLGCPVSDEVSDNNGGRSRKFEHGEIAWAPRQGAGMTIAVWQAGDSAWLQWGQTDTHFDKFLVRYDYEHNNIGQEDWAPGNGGKYQLNTPRAGNYGFSVQGCNGDCQGWDKTVEVYVDVADPQGVSGGLKVVTTGLTGMNRTIFSRDDFFSAAFNRAWSQASGALCGAIVQAVGGADRIAPGFTLHSDVVCRLAPRGVLFLDDASGTTGAVDVVFDIPHNYFEATTTQPSVFGSYADPRFSFTYEIALQMRVDPVNMKVLALDYAVINASKPDSHNVAADVMNTIGPIVAPSVLRRVRASLAVGDGLDVNKFNDALQDARNAVAADLQGHTPSWAINGGDVLVTLAGPRAATAQKVTNSDAQDVARDKLIKRPVSAKPARNVQAGAAARFRKSLPVSASSHP